jgi:ElaB/YqjD/DUF883 family membrane-anchored ribosome-binding protein
MGEAADQLRQEVDQKRDDAAQKIDQIQAKVEGATQQVKETVDDAKQQVKDAFDLRKQIEEKPLLALGAALAGGFSLGGVIGDDDRGDHRYPRNDEGPRTAPYRPQSSSSGVRDGIRKAARSTGLEDTLNTMVASFMGALGDRVRAIGEEAFPNLMPQQQGGGPEQASNRDAVGASSGTGRSRPMATTETMIPQTDDAPAGASF